MVDQRLVKLKLAAPCPKRWDDMRGDDKVRFCDQCSKNVFNLSGLNSEAALELIRRTEGKICARFYQRADGTVLTKDCPVGVARARRSAAAAIAIVAALVAFPVAAAVTSGGSSHTSLAELKWRARSWPVVGVVLRLLYPYEDVGGALVGTPPP